MFCKLQCFGVPMPKGEPTYCCKSGSSRIYVEHSTRYSLLPGDLPMLKTVGNSIQTSDLVNRIVSRKWSRAQSITSYLKSSFRFDRMSLYYVCPCGSTRMAFTVYFAQRRRVASGRGNMCIDSSFFNTLLDRCIGVATEEINVAVS
jgi:hypothetical protein